MAAIVRLVVIGAGIVQLLLGAGLVLGGDGSGLWLVASGAVLVVIPLVERGRYRSEAAEHGAAGAGPGGGGDPGATTGPGGGEGPGAAVERRFRPTAEVFVDPTTGRRIRVLADAASGERRYVDEG